MRAHLVGSADAFKAVSTPHNTVQDRGRGENAQPSFGESPQQREVIELSYYCWPNMLGLEPLVQFGPNGGVVAR